MSSKPNLCSDLSRFLFSLDFKGDMSLRKEELRIREQEMENKSKELETQKLKMEAEVNERKKMMELLVNLATPRQSLLCFRLFLFGEYGYILSYAFANFF